MSTVTATRRRRRLGALGVVAAAAIGAASLMPAASAAPVDLTAPVSGDLDIGGNAGEIPAGTVFTGTWDDELFTFDGNITYGAASTTVDQPGIGLVDIGLQITELTPVTGSFDPTAGTAEATTSVTLTLTSLTLPDQAPLALVDCDFTPINLDLTGTVTAADDGSYSLQLSADGFTIPPVGATGCNNLAALINPALAGDNNSVTLQMSTAADQEIPDTTTSTTDVPPVPMPEGEVITTTTVAPGAPTDPPAAGGAAPISASPSYTG